MPEEETNIELEFYCSYSIKNPSGEVCCKEDNEPCKKYKKFQKEMERRRKQK